jgi:hypothetical protein
MTIRSLLLIGIAAAGLAGCATPTPLGFIYYDAKLPVTATSNSASTRVGTATCESILSVVALGDCTIEAAKRNGNITKVTNVDWDARNILGVYGTYTTKVYGD